MLRPLVFFAALAIASSALAQEEKQGEPRADYRRDGFVIQGDACGASRYERLIGENYAELQQASLIPTSSNVVDRLQIRTLEYRPARLNFVLGGDGRVVAVGCF